jgi:hypothetical protein
LSSPSLHHTHTTTTRGIKTVEWERGRERGWGAGERGFEYERETGRGLGEREKDFFELVSFLHPAKKQQN